MLKKKKNEKMKKSLLLDSLYSSSYVKLSEEVIKGGIVSVNRLVMKIGGKVGNKTNSWSTIINLKGERWPSSTALQSEKKRNQTGYIPNEGSLEIAIK